MYELLQSPNFHKLDTRYKSFKILNSIPFFATLSRPRSQKNGIECKILKDVNLIYNLGIIIVPTWNFTRKLPLEVRMHLILQLLQFLQMFCILFPMFYYSCLLHSNPLLFLWKFEQDTCIDALIRFAKLPHAVNLRLLFKITWKLIFSLVNVLLSFMPLHIQLLVQMDFKLINGNIYHFSQILKIKLFHSRAVLWIVSILTLPIFHCRQND